MKPIHLVWLASTCLSIPINITTYNYLSYNVSDYYYLNSDRLDLAQLEVGVDQHFNQDYLKQLLVISDSNIVKLNHDYNNILYCFLNYLKKQKNRLSFDQDLNQFININKSTDLFLEKVIKRNDIKQLMGSFNYMEASSIDSMVGPIANYQNGTVNINLVHLYHLVPNVNNTFQYQIFHNLKFQYPNLDSSLDAYVSYLIDNSLVKSLIQIIHEFKNFELKINNDLTWESNQQPVPNQIGLIDNYKSQINLLIILNLSLVLIKCFDIFNAVSISFPRVLL